MYDLLIVGGGPAGVSAALTARSRGREVLVVTNPPRSSPLARAKLVTNYPGMDAVSGRQMLEAMHHQLRAQEIPLLEAKVVQILPAGDRFVCAAGSEVYEGRGLILTVGAAPRTSVEGEEAYLGRGVSYCATCDGMLYRNRTVAVLGFGGEAPEEAAFLAGIGCRVLYFAKGERPAALAAGMEFRRAVQYRIQGDGTRVTGLEADGYLYPADGVFLLRDSVAADSLLPGLEMDGGHIRVDATMAASLPGVFAAGDCVGRPYQVAKAVGEGNIAALTADRWLSALGKESTENGSFAFDGTGL